MGEFRNRSLRHFEKIMKRKLGIDALISMFPYEKDTIIGLWDLITDTCSSRKKVIYIAGEAKSASVVKSRFMKLDMSHLQYVMKCLNENSTRINNIRQYILTTLYNAPSPLRSFTVMVAGPAGVFLINDDHS